MFLPALDFPPCHCSYTLGCLESSHRDRFLYKRRAKWMLTGSAPTEVNEWEGREKLGQKEKLGSDTAAQEVSANTYRVLHWDVPIEFSWIGVRSLVLSTGINTGLEVCFQREHDCQFPERGLSGEIVKLYRDPFQLWLIHQGKGKGKGMNKNIKKSAPFIFLGISCFRVFCDNIFPQNAQPCWSVAQALCHISVKTISESLRRGNQPCQISIKCTRAHSRRVKLPRL